MIGETVGAPTFCAGGVDGALARGDVPLPASRAQLRHAHADPRIGEGRALRRRLRAHFADGACCSCVGRAIAGATTIGSGDSADVALERRAANANDREGMRAARAFGSI
jgi:hypothetical protein